MNDDDGIAPVADIGAEPALPAWVSDPERAYAEIRRLRQENAAQRQARRTVAGADEPPLADRQSAKIAELEAQLKTAGLNALRAQVAAEYGLPPKLAARLQGETEADLRRDADDLRAIAPSISAGLPGASGRAATTPLPGGAAAGESDAQRRARLFGGSSMFSGGRVVYHGDGHDLDESI